jgi:hypothetical protein
VTREATYPASYQSAMTAPPLGAAEHVYNTQWHATWNLPLKVAGVYLITSYNYDSKGNLLELIDTPTTDPTGAKGFNATPSGETQTTRWTYDAKNLPTTIVELAGSTETGRWNISYDTQGDMVGITHVTSGTVATLVPVGNGASQVVSITQGASPAVNPAMVTVRAQGMVRPQFAYLAPLLLPTAAEATAGAATAAAGEFVAWCAGIAGAGLGIIVANEAKDASCEAKPDGCRKKYGKPPPEDIPSVDWGDPAKPPKGKDGRDWTWRGKPPQGGKDGGYVNPSDKDQSAHPDTNHAPPIGPHWDFTDRNREPKSWRFFPDGRVEPK